MENISDGQPEELPQAEDVSPGGGSTTRICSCGLTTLIGNSVKNNPSNNFPGVIHAEMVGIDNALTVKPQNDHTYPGLEISLENKAAKQAVVDVVYEPDRGAIVVYVWSDPSADSYTHEIAIKSM